MAVHESWQEAAEEMSGLLAAVEEGLSPTAATPADAEELEDKLRRLKVVGPGSATPHHDRAVISANDFSHFSKPEWGRQAGRGLSLRNTLPPSREEGRVGARTARPTS